MRFESCSAALRFGQQQGTDAVAIHDGIDLARIERFELGGVSDQPAQPGLECSRRSCLVPAAGRWIPLRRSCRRRQLQAQRGQHTAGITEIADHIGAG